MNQFPSAHSSKYQVKGKLMAANGTNLYAYWKGNELNLLKADGTVVLENAQPFTDYLEILDVEVKDTTAPQDMVVLIGKEVTEKVGYNEMEEYQGMEQHPAPDPAVTNTKTNYVVERRVLSEHVSV